MGRSKRPTRSKRAARKCQCRQLEESVIRNRCSRPCDSEWGKERGQIRARARQAGSTDCGNQGIGTVRRQEPAVRLDRCPLGLGENASPGLDTLLLEVFECRKPMKWRNVESFPLG